VGRLVGFRALKVWMSRPPSLSVVCFRFLDPSLKDEEAIAALNRRLLERLQLGGEAFLTGTELRGRFVLRACIINHRSRREDVDRMLAAIRRLALSEGAEVTEGTGTEGTETTGSHRETE
jgi:glutamate/tyrosine decarboxylase-like PLP-dependent enzyme